MSSACCSAQPAYANAALLIRDAPGHYQDTTSSTRLELLQFKVQWLQDAFTHKILGSTTSYHYKTFSYLCAFLHF